MKIKPFKTIYPKLDLITSPESFFSTVKYQYREYFQSGFFIQNHVNSFFIYTITNQNGRHRGLLASVSIEDYDNGNIVKHEKTLAAKEQKTIHLIMQREAMIKPALLTYKANNKLDSLLEQLCKELNPFYTITFHEEGQTHSFIQISRPDTIDKIKQLFEKEITKSYIADGHHRLSATSILNKSDTKFDFSYLLVAFFSFSELNILDYNRTIQILHEISPAMVMAKLSKLFEIEILETGRKPKEKFELVLLMHKEWFSLIWKKEILIKYNDHKVILDANLLNELVLQDQFSIKDVGSDIRVGYVTGKDGVKAIERNVEKNEYRIGFILYPISIDEMIYISDKNLTLPPKSTWFEPRIVNGLISQPI